MGSLSRNGKLYIDSDEWSAGIGTDRQHSTPHRPATPPSLLHSIEQRAWLVYRGRGGRCRLKKSAPFEIRLWAKRASSSCFKKRRDLKNVPWRVMSMGAFQIVEPFESCATVAAARMKVSMATKCWLECLTQLDPRLE